MVEKFTKLFAQVISFVFNPFIIPSLALWIVLNHMPGFEMYTTRIKSILFLIVAASTCVIPILFLLILTLSPNINRDMMHHRDRILPYIFSAFSIYMGAQLLGKLPVPRIFSLFLTGSSIVLVVLFVITTKWKISGHGAGVGGLVGTLLSITFRYGIDLTWPIIAAILIAGAVGSSRILLEKHTPAQVYAGFSVGLVFMYATIYLF